MIDDNIKESLQRYVEHRIPLSGFLTAVLENNLMEAMGRADIVNRVALYNICMYVYNNLPSSVWGNPEKVKNHLKNR